MNIVKQLTALAAWLEKEGEEWQHFCGEYGPEYGTKAAEVRTLAETAAAPETLSHLQECESLLSLLRYRCERTIPWGTPGLPDLRVVDDTIARTRRTLAQANGEPAPTTERS